SRRLCGFDAAARRTAKAEGSRHARRRQIPRVDRPAQTRSTGRHQGIYSSVLRSLFRAARARHQRGHPTTRAAHPGRNDPLALTRRRRRQVGDETPNWPRITVVTPSFNQGRFLPECIESILRQDYPNLEYFVIDGGSTDESVRVLERYQDHITWWVSEPD